MSWNKKDRNLKNIFRRAINKVEGYLSSYRNRLKDFSTSWRLRNNRVDYKKIHYNSNLLKSRTKAKNSP